MSLRPQRMPDGRIFYRCTECGDGWMDTKVHTCGRILNIHGRSYRTRSIRPRGLGDKIGYALSFLGVTPKSYKRFKQSIGLLPRCGCSKRKTTLNKIGRYFGIGVKI